MFISPIQPSIGFKAITEIKRSEPKQRSGGSSEGIVPEPSEKNAENSTDKTVKKSPKEETCKFCNHKRNLASATGWSAASLIGLAAVSGMTNSHTVHKTSAMLGITAAAAHIGIVTSNHHHSHSKKDIQA